MPASKHIPSSNSSSNKKIEFVIGTNSSSIVSKRSVERLYFPTEPHFYRYFVKKPKRRSPLINRGYWLRIKAIDYALRNFLYHSCHKRRVVINLGCGFDPLPWQCLSRYQSACEGVVFIDVDHKNIILEKRTIVQETPELNYLLANIEISESNVLLRSDQYLQVGCDLSDLAQLSNILSNSLDLVNSAIFFIAEVSLTYMDVEAADNLIKWASNLSDAKFCLLEQILPGGIEHAFAHAMMAHFEKLRTPLGAVRKYPTIDSQRKRFKNQGWSEVSAQNLWELWASDEFLTSKERIALDAVEPFDEWEEFSLFGNHYFILLASSRTQNQNNDFISNDIIETSENQLPYVSNYETPYSWCEMPQNCRRFAAPLFVKSNNRTKDRIALFGGTGFATRLNSRDEYTSSEQDSIPSNHRCSTFPRSRMCHTITDLGEIGALLVGGRTSPTVGLSDCWIHHKFLDVWERVDDLPWPLYRHQALKIGLSSVLVSFGRIDSRNVSSAFLLWSRRTGWAKCDFAGIIPEFVYGPVIFGLPGNDSNVEFGILAGGMNKDGVMVNKVWRWVLRKIFTEPTIEFHESKFYPELCRFGASTVMHQGKFYLFGGIVKDKLLECQDEICCIDVIGEDLIFSRLSKPSYLNSRFLLIGSSVVSTDKAMVIMGGSVVCFSFGTFWNESCLTLVLGSTEIYEKWRLLGTVEDVSLNGDLKPGNLENQSVINIPRVRLQSEAHFTEILSAGKPVIFEELDIGPCVSKWSLEYLRDTIGEKREVIVHEASSEYMNFTSKNFKYRSMRFGAFITQVQQGAKLYLRSLSDKPSLIPADISKDFPSICSDFSLPPELSLVTKNSHSSPLRISGPVIMWLHYDTLANVLCQIQGDKKFLLFHPSDFKYFDFEPGKSSSPVNVFQSSHDDRLNPSKPYEALLKPGDVIYIPPFWLHSASPAPGTSVSVNIFFKNFSTGYATGKDIYGNRDLHVYEKGRQDISKITESFNFLPPEIREFYLQRLVEEFKQKASIHSF